MKSNQKTVCQWLSCAGPCLAFPLRCSNQRVGIPECTDGGSAGVGNITRLPPWDSGRTMQLLGRARGPESGGRRGARQLHCCGNAGRRQGAALAQRQVQRQHRTCPQVQPGLHGPPGGHIEEERRIRTLQLQSGS